MGSALCVNCGAEFHWNNHRGALLGDVTSPCCAAHGKVYRRDIRPHLWLVVRRLGGISAPATWQWRQDEAQVFVLRGGNIQLSNRVRYMPTERVGGVRVFIYAGGGSGYDPYCVGYLLTMADADYRALRALIREEAMA